MNNKRQVSIFFTENLLVFSSQCCGAPCDWGKQEGEQCFRCWWWCDRPPILIGIVADDLGSE